jgi:hypothetical protein
MDYTIAVVPPGGGETDYSITIRGAPFIPRPGEYVIVVAADTSDEDEGPFSAFKVRYATTYAKAEGDGAARLDGVTVEAEPIFHPFQTARHRRNVEMYEARGRAVESYPESGY